jgi:transposase
MRQVRELMRLHREAGLGMRATARLAGIAKTTMRDMVKRFESTGLTCQGVLPPLSEAISRTKAHLARTLEDCVGAECAWT